MTEILDAGEKQVVLYSKGHFKSTNELEDLRILTAEAFGIPLDSTMKYHVYDYVLNIFLKLIESGHILTTFQKFMESIFHWETPVLDQEKMIRKFMSHIAIVKAEGLYLGEADYSILPRYERV